MDIDVFHEFSTKYGLDSEIVASFCESFATHVALPKEKWSKYHPLVEVKVVEPVKVEEKTITYNVDMSVLGGGGGEWGGRPGPPKARGPLLGIRTLQC